MKDAGRQALKAGLDVECPNPNGYTQERLQRGIEDGSVKMEWIDRSVRRVLEMKIRLGLLDEKEFDDDRSKCFHAPESYALSLRTAREATVLLKNDGILPLKKTKQKIAVIGPHADCVRYHFGCYTQAAGLDMSIGGSMSDQAGMEEMATVAMSVNKNVETYPESSVQRDNPQAIAAVEQAFSNTRTVLKSLQAKVPEASISYLRGCDVAGNDRSQFGSAQALAKAADVVVVTVGGKYGWGGSCTIGEGIDSDRIGLPGIQEELVLSLIETGTPVIVVHMDARPLCSPAITEKASAILEYWFPGTTGGDALADILFGDYNPAGRLPITVPRNEGQIPVYNGQYCGNSYYSKYAPIAACRYVDSTVEPLYYFGQGLSYTTFEYSDLEIQHAEIPSDGAVTVSCKVKNTGKMAGEEVVQIYVSDLVASRLRPYQEFAGAARISLAAGEEKKVSFTMRADQFAFVGTDDKWIIEAGEMKAAIGGSSNALCLEGIFRITDTAYIRPAKRGFYASVKVS